MYAQEIHAYCHASYNFPLGSLFVHRCMHNIIHKKYYYCQSSFFVAPINITRSPPNYEELMGVQERRFTVFFTGRQSQNIAVWWYRNGVELHNTQQQQISTAFSEEDMTGNTTIYFPEMRRSHSGVYRVVVSTDFAEGEIERELRRQDVSFQVDVRGQYRLV